MILAGISLQQPVIRKNLEPEQDIGLISAFGGTAALLHWKHRYSLDSDLPAGVIAIGSPLRKPARKEETARRSPGTNLAALNCSQEHFMY